MNARHLDKTLSNHFNDYKQAIILLGARQTGKTTILHKLFPGAYFLTLDNASTKNALERYDQVAYQSLVTGKLGIIVIDEIQQLSDPGRCAKIFYDLIPQNQYIFTGSSAYNIKNKTSESLAGRKIDYYLYPLTLSEYITQLGLSQNLTFSPLTNLSGGDQPETIKSYDHQAIFDDLLLYGSYPHLVQHPRDELYLKNLLDSVVFKDLTELQLLENRSAALSLLQLLAHQIGQLVNYAEIASRIGIDTRTVKRYISLFEQSYIIQTLHPFSQNHRDEIGKSPKIYFHDLGLRNALIGNFSSLQSRSDYGALFENFIIMDLYKYNQYSNGNYHFNYWRTKSGSEIDLVLSKPDGTLLAIEVKNQSRRVNTSFTKRYPLSKLIVISRDNYWA